MSNPFTKFAASKPLESSGWLNVKKRGRDDDAIARDSKAAVEQRKKFRNQNTSSKTKKKSLDTKKGMSNRKAKKITLDSSDDNDSFIASESEEESIHFSDEEEDDEEEEEEEELEFDEEEEEDEEDEISLKESDDDDDGEEEDDEIIEVDSSPEKPKRMKSVKVKKTKQAIVLDSSSDDDDLLPSMTKRESTSKSKYFDTDISSPKLHVKVNPQQKKKVSAFSDSEDDDEGERSKKPKVPLGSTKVRNTSVNTLSDTDEEESLTIEEQDQLDEAIILSKVLHDSLKDKKYKSDIESESENEDNNEEEEEYVDENEKEASDVLRAANELSAHILKVMHRWSGSSKGMILDGALSVASLHTTSSSEEKKEEDDETFGWITKEEMKRCCPEIELKDYQLLGVNWLALLHRLTFNIKGGDDKKKKKKEKKGGDSRNVNGVLADEMGLGKTCQTIAFLAWLKYQKQSTCGVLKQPLQENGPIELDDSDADTKSSPRSIIDDGHRPHIVIVPASVLTNWMREFEKFCPKMNVIKYHGSMSERQDIKNQLRAYLPKTRGVLKYGTTQKRLDVVVTTYSYFSSEKSDDRSFLRKFEWDYMVVDEAHCLKNPTGARYKNMDAFNTKRRILLTGTPVQNSPKELMSLLCFLMPLFTRQVTGFDESDSKNDGGARMLEHFVHLEAIDKNSEKFGEEEVYKKLKQLLAPFVLRRLKSEVLAQWLPSKKRHIEWVPFDAKSKAIYDSIMASHLQSRLDGGSSESSHVFTCLRKAANHGLLLRTRFKSPEDEEHLSNALFSMGYFGRDESCTLELVKKELSNFSDYDIHCAVSILIAENDFRKHELGRYLLQEEDLFCSPKFCRLREMLPKLIDEGHRMLIFSQWTSILDLLECLMNAMNLRFMRLDGQTNIQERQNLIDEFSNDLSIPVFLLSTRAGGMGLNLTAADTCILHDLDFNPFNDIQAEDRIHRIGQKKPVTIIKMITEGTVDADIFKMQERKTAMNAAILEKKCTVNKKDDDAAMSAILAMAVTRYNKDSDKTFSP